MMCQEIVENVCEFLSPSSSLEDSYRRADDKGNKGALARLARTCKAFSDPALRVLWRRLDTIRNLLQLLPQYRHPLPSDAFKMLRSVTPRQTLISSKPDEDDWTRLRSYAIRVRELEYCIWTRVDSASSSILSDMCNGGPLLPRLERLLEFDISAGCDAVIVELLFPVSLRSITLSCDAWYEGAPALKDQDTLQSIIARVPNLRNLSLDRNVARCTSLDSIKKLQDLQSLSLDVAVAVDDVILVHCGFLPSLRDFSCRIDTRHATKRPNIRGAFHSLSRISLQGSARDIVWFFEETSAHNLREVSLVFDWASTADELLQSVPEALNAVPPLTRSVSVRVTIELSQPLSLIDALEPLRDLQALEEVIVTCRQPVSLPADDLVHMATAWSHLRVLHVSGHGFDPLTTTLHARILELVALRCPRLESLWLPRLEFCGLPLQEHEPVLDHGLADLDFYPIASVEMDADAEQDDPDALDGVAVWQNAALLIDRLFPALDLDATDGPRLIRIAKKGGREITRFLSALHIGRRHARCIDNVRVDGVGEHSCGFSLTPILS
ncbi:hypothetical protein K466DRAFT_605025 [Polyporus arcularius HHB13444]|uniref:F-box domain-containing protein n=1 Tax=Polyporus arcularius HHB13444 TaxID=1314778 RepID=A0A5C3NU83_9APHY|nr:hypothetical protein K466DRAFT_605025 [Polyporus arcularius HHB13444]